MLRVLIVEDEPLVRIGLVSAIDWRGGGYELVGEASDGREALELCERLSPDIVITDIRMPRMDGLEFVRRLRELIPGAKVLVLSAYDEFSYAREALKLGVEDYLLKIDISPAALLEALGKVAVKCSAGRAAKAAPGETGGAEPGMQAKAEATRNLLLGAAPSASHGLDPAFAAGRLVVLYALVDKPAREPERAARPRLLVDSAAGLIRDCLRRGSESVTLIMSDAAIASVLAFDPVSSNQKLRDEIDRAYKRIEESLERSLGISASIGASVVQGGLAGLGQAYDEARKACGLRFFAGPGKLFLHRATERPARWETEIAAGDAPRIDRIVEALLDCDRDRVLVLLEEAARAFHGRPESDRDARVFFYRLACAFLDQIEAMGGDYRSVVGDDPDWIEGLVSAENIEALTARAGSLADRVIAFVSGHRSEHRLRVIARANAYIDANYTQELSLETLCAHLNINSSYFCKIYRQATGRTFVERLTKVRLDKAKALLQGSDNMVYSVAAASGYTNPEYFCRLFKKMTGLTPLQYRNAAKANGRPT